MKRYIALCFVAFVASAFSAVIPGFPITGPVVPSDTTDTFPSHLALYGKGGMRTVADTVERDTIPSARRESGMMVFTSGTKRIYMLGPDLTSWTEIKPHVVVDTFADLASIQTAGLANNAIVRSSGFYAAGDGGGSDYVYKIGSTSTNLPHSPVTGGALQLARWNGELEVFGAKSGFLTNATDAPSLIGIDSSSAIQAAVNYAASIGGGTLSPMSGTYWLSKTIQWKPKVAVVGKSPSTGSNTSRSTSSGRTARLFGQTYWEGYNASGIGFPVVVLDGSLNYTNEYTVNWTNRFGEVLAYRASGNSFEKIAFSCYQWGTGSTNKYPVAGIVIDQCEGVVIQNCAFHDIAGFGVWEQAALGRILNNSQFRNCLLAGLFTTSGSDSRITGNTFGGTPVWLYAANSHVISNNEMWNPYHSLLTTSGATTNLSDFGITRPFLIERQHWSDASTDEFIQGSQWGADVGHMVIFKGSGIPSPFVAGQPYFVINKAGDTARIKLAATPRLAISGTAIDVTQSSTNGTWSLTTFTDALVGWDSEELFYQNNRLDQTWKNGVRMVKAFRSQISGNQIWEIGMNMGPARFNRIEPGERFFSGVWLEDCGDAVVNGNVIQGGFRVGPTVASLMGRYDGVYLTNCINVGISGNTFSDLKHGIFSDTGCSNVRDLGNTFSPTVHFHARAANTAGLSANSWPGILLAGSNVVWSAQIPSAKTNLTDFTLTVGLPWGTPQITGNDHYEPILILGPSTNYSTAPLTAEGSLALSMYTFNAVVGETNSVIIVNQAGPPGSYRRATQNVVEPRIRDMPLEVVITRSGGTWKFFRNGFELGLIMNVTGGSAPTNTAPIHAARMLLGPWSNTLYRNGWVTEVVLQDKAFSAIEIRDGRHRLAGTNLVMHWDFKGDTGSTVLDKSGNGVNGTVVSLNGTTLHSFGPTQK